MRGWQHLFLAQLAAGVHPGGERRRPLHHAASQAALLETDRNRVEVPLQLRLYPWIQPILHQEACSGCEPRKHTQKG